MFFSEILILFYRPLKIRTGMLYGKFRTEFIFLSIFEYLVHIKHKFVINEECFLSIIKIEWHFCFIYAITSAMRTKCVHFLLLKQKLQGQW